MTSAVASDRLKAFVDLLVDSLDDLAAGAELAARADLSRYHFQRLVGAALGETPGAFRRRLLLERAAWELREGATVTEAALTAVYGSRRSCDAGPPLHSRHAQRRRLMGARRLGAAG